MGLVTVFTTSSGRLPARALRAGLVVGFVASVLAVGSAQPAHAAPPPEGTVWTEHYFPSPDGITMLHADVLRPKGLSDKDRTPVILTVSPYLNHSGQTSEYDPNAEGPSSRFYDFLEVSRAIQRGYTYVMVDLPGFGGSSGCNDWGGVREQEATATAVEWAASQPWSNGRVGMMGKSYDAWTGLMAMAQKPKGLAAVVAMEPVYSGYRYLYNNRVRFFNSLITPAGFQVYDAKPGSLNDDPMYNVNGAPQAWCYGVNYGLQQIDDPSSPYWQERDLLPPTKGSRIPLFLTQGFLETNTKPDAAFDFFNALRGPNRAWFGQFNHVRGWEQNSEGRYEMGRSVFADEMMRFFDLHLKGRSQARPLRGRPVSVQDNLGRYRAEAAWPPNDSKMWTTRLRTGSYTDDGNQDQGGIWSISQPLPHDAWLAGEPRVELTVTAVPRANLVAEVYDIAPGGAATLVSHGTRLFEGAGPHEASLELYGQDWVLRRGHRVGVRITDAGGPWVHIPTFTPVTVDEARVDLPFLRLDRTKFLDGSATPELQGYLAGADVTVTDARLDEAGTRFRLPPPLKRAGRSRSR